VYLRDTICVPSGYDGETSTDRSVWILLFYSGRSKERTRSGTPRVRGRPRVNRVLHLRQSASLYGHRSRRACTLCRDAGAVCSPSWGTSCGRARTISVARARSRVCRARRTTPRKPKVTSSERHRLNHNWTCRAVPIAGAAAYTLMDYALLAGFGALPPPVGAAQALGITRGEVPRGGIEPPTRGFSGQPSPWPSPRVVEVLPLPPPRRAAPVQQRVGRPVRPTAPRTARRASRRPRS
jgi:hypothetical protein